MDSERLCAGCGQALASTRPNRRYHGPQCRKLGFRARQRDRQATPPAPIPAFDRSAVLEEALSEPRLAVYVATSARSSWRAAAWLLERRYPERWSTSRAGAEAPPPAPSDELAKLRELHAAIRERQ